MYSRLIIFLIFFQLMYSDEVSGNVSGTWNTDGSPYVVTGNLVLLPTDSLIVEPGTNILFSGPYKFDIFGYFHAVGAENDLLS